MLRKANQKRSLDDLVIQKGEFDWRTLFGDADGASGTIDTSGFGLAHALEELVDSEDARAARIAAQEAGELEGADEADFGGEVKAATEATAASLFETAQDGQSEDEEGGEDEGEGGEDGEREEEEGGSTVEYMLSFVRWDGDHFADWRL